ncbi:MAG: DUF3467 domain-containing protein [Chitinophagales bacterium]|jgi:hypothetical protein|nr:DUF3467 domain-containing protein [Chitinophagales bacterium]
MEHNNQIEIEISNELLSGVYSNLAIIAHSPSEFVVDFVQISPGTPKAHVRSRVIIAPENMKRLLTAMQDNIRKYEDNFGKINQSETPPVYPNSHYETPPTSV